ncbi:MAG: ATP-binding protein [Candidatus Dormibacteria bacterium]
MPEVISPELRQVLRRLHMSPILETLPERLQLARQQKMPYQEFIELIFADEAARRDRVGSDLRSRTAHLDMSMRLESWDDTTNVTFDRQLWNELCTLRFMEQSASVLILGPVGVGKTMLATSLGHIATRRKHSAFSGRADQIFKRLKASRLDGTYDQELRRLLRVDLLILDDVCLQAMDAIETHDFYEIVVERYRRSSMVLTSNREPKEWLSVMADPMLAQSAVDRIANSAFELVLEGESYRPRQKPQRSSS